MLTSRIPRQEVEDIAGCVMENLDALLPGCQYTICGGYVSKNPKDPLKSFRYRRGKTESNDVDIVFSPPEDADHDADVGLLKDLYLRLSTLGIVTHVLRMFRFSEDTSFSCAPVSFQM